MTDKKKTEIDRSVEHFVKPIRLDNDFEHIEQLTKKERIEFFSRWKKKRVIKKWVTQFLKSGLDNSELSKFLNEKNIVREDEKRKWNNLCEFTEMLMVLDFVRDKINNVLSSENEIPIKIEFCKMDYDGQFLDIMDVGEQIRVNYMGMKQIKSKIEFDKLDKDKTLDRFLTETEWEKQTFEQIVEWMVK